jgi:DNA-binding NtrC family response regulator
MSLVLMAVKEPRARSELSCHFIQRRREVVESATASDINPSKLSDVGLFVVECSTDEPGGRLSFIERFRTVNPRVPVIALAVKSSEDLAVAAFRSGVRDYFRWPEHASELGACLDRCLPPSSREMPSRRKFVGQSSPIRAVVESLERAATTDSNVLVTGETGTGKEFVAESVHGLSARRHKALVSVNCAAIPETLLESELFGHERGAFTGAIAPREGKLQQANGGTIFFDEIGDMNLQGQAKLLRVLETREVFPLGGRRQVNVDVRIVAATNQNLESMSRVGSFRADLLFRLNVVHIHLPPLRERVSDIPSLLTHFTRQFNERWGMRLERFDDECQAVLCRHSWPGNVRELKNVVEAVYVNSRGGVIGIRDLPAGLLAAVSGGGGPDEKRRLTDALLAMNWNVSRAAEKLHWSRMTVYRKLARYHISREGGVTGDAGSDSACDMSVTVSNELS